MISPALVSDLQAAIDANFRNNWNPVVLQQLSSDDRGFLEIRVRAYGETEEQVHELCKMAERGNAIVLPAKNSRSSNRGYKEGDKAEFVANLYHIGCWTHPNYGMQYIHRFQDEEENEYTWKTSKPHPLGRYDLSGKVSGFTNFGDIEQTTLSRCKLERIE